MKGRANSLFLWVMGGLVGDGAVMEQRRTIGGGATVGVAQPALPRGCKVRYSQDHEFMHSCPTRHLDGRQ